MQVEGSCGPLIQQAGISYSYLTEAKSVCSAPISAGLMT